MSWGLPKLPGLTFYDSTRTLHHRKNSLKYYQGYRFPDTTIRGIGGDPTDVDSSAFSSTEESATYDPSLTYGRVKQSGYSAVLPQYVHYANKCLNFTAFYKQAVHNSPVEHFRIQPVNIIYYLEDDTIMVMEQKVRNSGLNQGRMVKRGKHLKNDQGDYLTWKDLDNGKDIMMYGKVFHTVSCDVFTQEYLASQGIELSPPEVMPTDPYTAHEKKKAMEHVAALTTCTGRKADDAFRKFLQFGGKILKFTSVWDDRDSEYGELREYSILYFLEDDTIAVKETKDELGGRDPFPLLLRKTKLPKKWKEKPATFPSISMETTEAEVTEYYCPSDLIVGETIFVLGRRFLLCDCDKFTRDYYRNVLSFNQPEKIEIPKKGRKEVPRTLPPHIVFGRAEDSLQSCFSLLPKEPFKDIVRYNFNANKYLRYLCELDSVFCEDVGRRFVLAYSLASGAIKIGEIKRRNSGIIEGTFLKSTMIPKPDSDPNFPTYLTPEQFYIGAVIPVFKHRFKIIGCDLFVYRYMLANPDKFPKDVIENIRNYHMREGNLKEELQAAYLDDTAKDRLDKLHQMGKSAVAEKTYLEKCMADLSIGEVEEPPPPLTTTKNTDYDGSLNSIRADLTPEQRCFRRGILRSGKKEMDPKAVNFSREESQKQTTPRESSRQPREDDALMFAGGHKLYDDDPDFCDSHKDYDDARRKRHEAGICPYPLERQRLYAEEHKNAVGEGQGTEASANDGYLKHRYSMDCKQPPTEYDSEPKEIRLSEEGQVCDKERTPLGVPPEKLPPPCCYRNRTVD